MILITLATLLGSAVFRGIVLQAKVRECAIQQFIGTMDVQHPIKREAILPDS